MITVEWSDWNAQRNPDFTLMVRTGKLLQVAPVDHDHNHVAYVITRAIDSDVRHSPVKVGDTIILHVALERLKVKGVEVSLFDGN